MFILDGFEGDWAIVEYGNCTFHIPKALLPSEVREGDIINFIITIDEVNSKQRKKDAQKLLEDMFESE